MTESIAEKVKNAGVVGAGGAGFPTHVKLLAKVDTIVVNGAECEPLLYSDQVLMENFAGEIVDGLRLAREATGATRAIFAIKEKYTSAIEAVKSQIAGDNIEIFKIGNFYPAGDEQVLVYETTGKVVPEGGIPLEVGVVVQNVNTLLNIARASRGEPVLYRHITVGGEVAEPAILTVPIGASLKDLIDACGGVKPGTDSVMLVNGPMMGYVTRDETEPVTKTTGGLFVLPASHSYVRRKLRPMPTELKWARSICEQCRYCTDFCPRWLLGHSLEPHKIVRVVDYNRDNDPATVTRSYLCCECGLCDLYACPMNLSPRLIFREFKKQLAGKGLKNPHRNTDLSARDSRKHRQAPKGKLIRRLGLADYDIKPPFRPNPIGVKKVRIKLSAHVGAPAVPIVKPGDWVTEGKLIAAAPEGKLGAAYHASIEGAVESVENGFIEIARR